MMHRLAIFLIVWPIASTVITIARFRELPEPYRNSEDIGIITGFIIALGAAML